MEGKTRKKGIKDEMRNKGETAEKGKKMKEKKELEEHRKKD